MGSADALLKVYDKNNSRTFKISAGEAKYVRLLPPYDIAYRKKAEKLGVTMDPKLGIVIPRVHKFLPKLNPSKEEIDRAQKFNKGDKMPVTNYRCLRDFKKPCPFCSFFDALGKEDKEIKFQYGSKPNPFADFYVKDLGICQRYYMPKTVMERICEIYDILPQLNHPTKGRNLIISRKGSTQFDTKYDVEVSKKVTKLPIGEDQYPDDILDELSSLVIIPGPKTAHKVLALKFPGLV